MRHLSRNSAITPRSAVLAAMIAAAVAVRLLIYFVPGVLPYNFTPVEAIALFGGAYFSDRRLAFLVPLGAMALADAVILGTLSQEMAGYWYRSAPIVYACIAVTVLGGFGLRGRVGFARVAGFSFASAVFFFLATNFAVWALADSGGSEACTRGLLPCYVAALPFFNGTLAGTLAWSAILFGGFELLRRRWDLLQPVTH
jgi:uncharacterized protein DUF6580